MTADPSPPKERCRGLTKSGQPCRAWAVRASAARYGRPLCAAHSGQGDGPQPAAVTAWEPPAALSGPVVPGDEETLPNPYAVYYTAEELVALDKLLQFAGEGESLAAEVTSARVALRRLLGVWAQLEEPAIGDLVKLVPLVLKSAHTVALLLQIKHAIGEPAKEEPEWFDEALDQLSEEWGIEL